MKLFQARNNILGPRELRQSGLPKPVKDANGNIVYSAGTAFERDPRAAENPVKPGTQAYGVMTNLQDNNGIVAPAYMIKNYDDDPWAEHVQALIKVNRLSYLCGIP